MAREFLKVWVARWQGLSGGTVNQRIFRATLTVSLMTAVVTLGFLLRDLIIAGWFGTGDELDAFLIALLVPWTTLNVLAAAFSGAVIPPFIRIRQQEGEESAQRFFSQVISLSAAALLAATVVLAATGPWLLAAFGSGFAPEKLALTRSLFHVLLPILFVGGMSKMLAAILNAGERFALAALVPAIGPVTAVLAVLVGAGRWGILALAVGTTCGYFLEFVLLGVALRRRGLWPVPQWPTMDPATRQVAVQYGYLLMAVLFQNCLAPTDQILAASLSSGSVSALNYATKLTGSLMGLGPAALEAAALPYLSVLAGRGDERSTQHTFTTYTFLAMVTTIPMAAAIIVFSEPVIGIVFQRGAFTAADTSLVAGVQAYWAMQLPFGTIMVLGFRALSASGRNSALAGIGLFNAVLNGVLGYALMFAMSVQGIALATTITYAAGAIVTYSIVRMMSTQGSRHHHSP
ncbi:MAG: virulence factor MviN [Desulfomonile tiedjei]|nr:virulence factor MviN [Desulfomonile tiedjei]